MEAFLLERPWRLLVALVAIEFLLICFWSWRRSAATRRAVYIGLTAIPLFLIVSLLVVTTREEVIQACQEMARYVDDGNAMAIEMRLTDDFEAESLSRPEFVQRLYDALKSHEIDYPELFDFQITAPTTDRAVVEFDATCRLRTPEEFVGQVASRWRLTMRKERDVWRLMRVEALPTPHLRWPGLPRWLD